ncbi:MAG: putative holin-like toxin [Caldicoprobacterales bacterium]
MLTIFQSLSLMISFGLLLISLISYLDDKK